MIIILHLVFIFGILLVGPRLVVVQIMQNTEVAERCLKNMYYEIKERKKIGSCEAGFDQN